MTSKSTKAVRPYGSQTRLMAAGRAPESHFGAVNVPPYRTSTVIFQGADRWLTAQTAKKAGKRGVYYGRLGTPTTHALEDALCELEGGLCTFLFPSGLSSIYHTFAAFARPGARFLVSQNAYEPSKRVASVLGRQFGISVVFFDPMNPSAIFETVSDETSLVLIESPGSNSFEVCNVDEIVAQAHARGAIVAMDNTWATPLLFRPLDHGVDVSIQALTKYVSGHSDMLGGSATVNDRALAALKEHYAACGTCLGPDECYSASKGLRTLPTRLAQHGASGLKVATWLSQRQEVLAVHHPALPDNPGHDYWRAHFKGSSGLFAVDFQDWTWSQTRTFLDASKLFGLGASWGGYESLALPTGNLEGESDVAGRSFARVRLHIGLEDTDDLIDDLANALDKVGEI